MFTEDNTIEKMLLSVAQEKGWTYVKAEDMPRSTSDIMVAQWLKEALLRLNPKITASQAEEVVQKIKAALYTTANELITANQRLRKLFFEENSYPFGKDGEHIPVKFFDMEDMSKNYCVVTNQWEFPRPSIDGGKRLDIVFLINGLPMVIGETKTPVRPAITWADGAKDIQGYERSIPEMFVSNAFNFATEGKEFFYAGIGAPLGKWGPWYESEARHHGTMEDVKLNFRHMLNPMRVLDIYRYYSIFTTNPSTEKKMKIVCRYQQYEGGEAIVQRVLENKIKKGLIWHFQGSGKSWLMVFAAQKLRNMESLNNPTVVIVDDRKDLEDQITGDFTRAEIPNLDSIDSKQGLIDFFSGDQRKIVITTIFKFGDVDQPLSDRSNIIVMVDEAHRTQERNLGLKMRTALPNAFFFGLTGTPINKVDKNTFATFGADEDRGGYMSKYSFQNSIDDGATLELEFKTVPVELKLNEEMLQKAFDELTEDISDEEKQSLVKKTSVEAFFTAPDRIRKVCEFIVKHYRDYIEPTGLKAQIVVYNRACCVAYKKELDLLLNDKEASTIVMHTAGDKADDYREWRRTRDEEKKLLNNFRDPLSPLKFVIVTSKLLTGFDAPILQCMYLDKPMKDHTLLQAICRTNRTYEAKKKCGLVVDFVGVFDNVAKSLAFDEESVKTVIKNIDEIKARIPEYLQNCLDFFPGVDRKISGFDGLIAAQQCIKDVDKKDKFAAHFKLLHKAWETVSPDECLNQYKSDYIWLSQVYESVKPVSPDGSLIWTILGPKTIELIHSNIEAIDIGGSLEDLVINSEVVEAVIEDAKNDKRKIVEIEKMLRLRLSKHSNNPEYRKLAEKLDELRQKMQENLISSIDFLKELLRMAQQVLEVEKAENQPEDKRQKAKAALTELFESVKSEDTPIIVEHVVNDIDEKVVSIVRKFNNAFSTITGQNEIKKQLRSILWIKYKIKDNEVFEKAYSYVEMYY